MKHLPLFISALIFLSLSCKTNTNPGAGDKKKQTASSCTENIDSACVFEPKDTVIFRKLMKLAKHQNWHALSTPERTINVAKFFVGTPYVANTLESDKQETLVINFRGLDCTTFVENVFVISSMIGKRSFFFDAYCDELTRTRYRNGKLELYISRLHYFTEWMDNNSKKGLIEIIDDTEGHEPYKKQINFMSKHPERYKKLKTEACIAKIKAIESSINQLEMKYIPENKIASAKTEINNGDLIAITTSIEGLDVMHNGIAIFKDDELHLIHASTVNNKVEISNVPLSEMIKQNQYMTGIMVSRLK